MKRFKRIPNRKKKKVKDDVIQTDKIIREDIYDIVKNCQSLREAEEAVREFLQEIPANNGSFRRKGKDLAIEVVISDLNSYKEWDE